MSVLGVVLGMIFAVAAIVRGIPGVFAMTAAALLAAVVGGQGLHGASALVIRGAQNMLPVAVRVMAAGVLAGALVPTGAAERIADSIIKAFGARFIYAALALAAFVLTSAGVFMDVTAITMAPIALAAAQRLRLPMLPVLLALSAGAKTGNFASPNAVTIAAAEAFRLPLGSLIIYNFIPAVAALGFSVLLCRLLGGRLAEGGAPASLKKDLPSLGAALSAPLAALGLLLLPPLWGIQIDPLIALPAGGIFGIFVMHKPFAPSLQAGVQKVSGVVLLLMGVGAFSEVISASNLKDLCLALSQKMNLSFMAAAPVTAMLLAALTGSATGSVVIASSVFVPLAAVQGADPLKTAALIGAGSMLFDPALHSSFFHNTRETLGMTFKERLQAVPWESLVSIVLVLCTALFQRLTP